MMSKASAIALIVAILMLFLPGRFATAAEAYRLNPGDVLQISVWKEEGMQRDVLVLPDGNISFPLAGHIKAAGRSLEELQGILVNKLKKFFAGPVITVSVMQLTGNKIFVIGQVRSPGQFLANRPIDVMQALSLAGGLTTFADEDAIKILRRGNNGKQQAIAFNYAEISKGRSLSRNIVLRSGDVVVVPTSGLF
jgi:polysaccharide export outer membrane protein